MGTSGDEGHAGVTWNDIVDVTVFLTDMENDFATYNRIYPEYFAGSGKPNPTEKRPSGAGLGFSSAG